MEESGFHEIHQAKIYQFKVEEDSVFDFWIRGRVQVLSVFQLTGSFSEAICSRTNGILFGKSVKHFKGGLRFYNK
jgi:hypothetical protein